MSQPRPLPVHRRIASTVWPGSDWIVNTSCDRSNGVAPAGLQRVSVDRDDPRVLAVVVEGVHVVPSAHDPHQHAVARVRARERAVGLRGQTAATSDSAIVSGALRPLMNQ